MKLVRGAAVLVGLIDLTFAFLLIIRPEALAEEVVTLFPRWLGVCLMVSAALLFLVASDAERFFPVVFVNVGGRALALLVGLLYITKQFVLVVTAVATNGALGAVLVASIAYAVKQKRDREAAEAAPAEAATAGADEGTRDQGAGPASGESGA